jgi:hypothetical protein
VAVRVGMRVGIAGQRDDRAVVATATGCAHG